MYSLFILKVLLTQNQTKNMETHNSLGLHKKKTIFSVKKIKRGLTNQEKSQHLQLCIPTAPVITLMRNQSFFSACSSATPAAPCKLTNNKWALTKVCVYATQTCAKYNFSYLLVHTHVYTYMHTYMDTACLLSCAMINAVKKQIKLSGCGPWKKRKHKANKQQTAITRVTANASAAAPATLQMATKATKSAQQSVKEVAAC